jgi:hypothetical protein
MNINQIGFSALTLHFLIFMFGCIILFSPESSINGGVSVGGYSFNLTSAITTIVISIAAILIALALIGIQGFASGLNDTSTYQIMKIVTYAACWGILSSVSYQYLAMLQFFGILIYSILTLIFAIFMVVGTGSDQID